MPHIRSAFTLSVASLLLALAVVFPARAADPREVEKLDPNFAVKDPAADIQWFDALQLGLEGQGWTENAHPYDRLPAKPVPTTARSTCRSPGCAASSAKIPSCPA